MLAQGGGAGWDFGQALAKPILGHLSLGVKVLRGLAHSRLEALRSACSGQMPNPRGRSQRCSK